MSCHRIRGTGIGFSKLQPDSPLGEEQIAAVREAEPQKGDPLWDSNGEKSRTREKYVRGTLV
jgi:hypothetical protein